MKGKVAKVNKNKKKLDCRMKERGVGGRDDILSHFALKSH